MFAPLAAGLPAPSAMEWFAFCGCAAAALHIYAKIVEIKANKARAKAGRADDPVHVHQPLEIKHASQPADKGEVERQLSALSLQVSSVAVKLESEVKGLMEVLSAQANSARVDAQHRVSDLSRMIGEGDDRLAARIDTYCKDLHDKVNAVDKITARHDEAIAAIKANVAAQKESITGVHRRVDDVIKEAKGRRSSS